MENALATKSLWDMLLAGGPLLLPILASSFVLLLVVFERTLSLRRSRVAPRLFAERFLLQIGEGALNRNEALDRCEQNRSHVANVFAAAVRRWGKPVEQAFLDEGERAASEMRRFLRVINGVATVCPLMGLLGTVWGMMEAFEAIAGSSARSAALHRCRPFGRHPCTDPLPLVCRPRRHASDGNRPSRTKPGPPHFRRSTRGAT